MKYVIVQSKENFIAGILAFVTTWSLILGVGAELNSISGTSYPNAVGECLPGRLSSLSKSMSKICGDDKGGIRESKINCTLCL